MRFYSWRANVHFVGMETFAPRYNSLLSSPPFPPPMTAAFVTALMVVVHARAVRLYITVVRMLNYFVRRLIIVFWKKRGMSLGPKQAANLKIH